MKSRMIAPPKPVPVPRSRFTPSVEPAEIHRLQPLSIRVEPAFGYDLLRLLGLMVAMTWIGFVAVSMKSYLMDDAFIGLRYVDHALRGKGFVFNSGETVEGVTNIGWLLLLLPFSAALGTALAAKLLGAICLAGTVLAATRVVSSIGGSRNDLIFAAAIPLLIATQTELVLFSNLGMESPLLALALMLIGWRAAHGLTGPGIGCAAGLLFSIHPEAVVIYPLAVAGVCGTGAAAWSRHRSGLAGWMFAVILITVTRWCYFGDLLPNTFYAKASSSGLALAQAIRWISGSNLNIPFPFASLLAAPFLAAGALAIRRSNPAVAAWLSASTAVGMLFCMYSGPDWTSLGRYFAPYVPAAMILFWRGFVSLARIGGQRTGHGNLARGGVIAVAIALVGVGVLKTHELISDEARQRYPGYVLMGSTLAEPAKWLGENLPADAVIATRRIGALSYFSDRRVFDYTFGLTDRGVARAIRNAGHGFHLPTDPALAELWQAAAPTHILEDRNVIEEIAAAAGGTPDDFLVHGKHYRALRGFRIGNTMDWMLCERSQQNQRD